MGLTILSYDQESEIQVPQSLISLVTSLNLTLAIWTSESRFSMGVTNYFVLVSPILLSDSTIDLILFPSAVVFLAFQNFTSVTTPWFNRTPNPKTRILLYTNDVDVAEKQLELEAVIEKLIVYRRSRFLWFNFHKQKVQIFRWNDARDALIQVNYANALDAFMDYPKPMKIPNFGGKEISIMVHNFTVYSYLAPAPNGSDTPWITEGIDVLLLQDACRMMNLTPVYLEGIDYGSFENGTFTAGMQQDVMEMRTDILVAGVYIRPGSVGVIQVDNPWKFACVRYLVPRPKLLNSSSRVLIVFSRDIWMIIAVTFIFTSTIVVSLANAISAPSSKRNHSTLNTWIELLFHLMQVRSPPRSDYYGSLAPLLLSWGWLGFLLTTLYNSELAASFTKPFYADKIQTTADLMENGFTWGTPHDFDWSILYDLSDPVLYKWVMEHHVLGESEVERERKLQEGNYVIVGFSYGEMFYFIEDEAPPDKLVEEYEVADECTTIKLAGIIFSPGSPYLDGFNLIKGRLRASGILQQDEYAWMMYRPKIREHVPKNVFTFSKESRRLITFTKLPLSIYSGVFVLLICGHAISTAVFCCEWAIERVRKKQEKNTLKLKGNDVIIVQCKRFKAPF